MMKFRHLSRNNIKIFMDTTDFNVSGNHFKIKLQRNLDFLDKIDFNAAGIHFKTKLIS